MTVTSVKSIKYLHSTAHEALDVWQLHTEDDETPALHVWDWELTGPCLATIHGCKGSRGSRQLLQDTQHYGLEACYDVTQVRPTPLPPPRWPHILEWQVQLIQNGDNTTFTLWRQPTPRHVL